jgi:hypothetical protein
LAIPLLFGRFLVRSGRIKENELARLLKVQSEVNDSYALTALNGGFVTLEKFKEIFDYQKTMAITFKEAMLELRVTDAAGLQAIEAAMKKSNVRIGELLITCALLTEEELNKALAEFKDKGTL